MSTVITLPKEKSAKKKKFSLVFYSILALAGLAAIVEGVLLSEKDLLVGMQTIPAYFNLTWAYEQSLIEQLIISTGMLWMVVTAFFFGSWLLHRSIRKLRGKPWRIAKEKDSKKRFFPPILIYLKLSCAYLAFIFFFVIFQYPIQFIFFTQN